MSLAYMHATLGNAHLARPDAPRAGTFLRAVPAALISISLHALAFWLWQPAPLSVSSSGAPSDTGRSTAFGLVVDLAPPLAPSPASLPAPTPSTTAPSTEPTPAAVHGGAEAMTESEAAPAPVAAEVSTLPTTPPKASRPTAPEPITEREAPDIVARAPKPAPKPAIKPTPSPRLVTSLDSRAALPNAEAPRQSPQISHTASGHSTDAASLPASPSLLPETQAGREPGRRCSRSSDRPGSSRRPAPPAYPARAVQLGLEGTAIVRALVGGAGAPSDVRLVRSSGFDMLDQAALDAVRTWRFASAVGVPRAWVELPIHFRLN